MVPLLLFATTVAVVALAVRRPPAPPRRVDAAQDPVALADTDPVEALLRHGTPDDARRLIAEGRGDELAGLGYRDGGG